MNKKKILVQGLCRINTKNRDGGGIRLNEVIKNWVKDGYEVHFLLPEREYLIIKEELKGAVFYVVRDLINSESESLINILPIYLMRTLTASFYYIFKMPRDFGLIYSPSDFLTDLIPAVLAKLRSKDSRLSVCFFLISPNPFVGYRNAFKNKRNSMPSLRGVIYFISQRFSLFLSKLFADYILVLNNRDKEMLSQRFNPSLIKVVSMGVDLKGIKNITTPQHKIYEGVFLGRFHPQKGIMDLPKIWRLVVDKKEDARLAIIGGGGRGWPDKLKKEIKRIGLSNNVDILGFREGREKFSLIKSSSFLLFPSYYESWGMVVCEAMSCGLPVVSYDLPVFKDLFPFGGIIKVPTGDYFSFANACLTLMKDISCYNKLAYEASQSAMEYDWQVVYRRELEELNL